MIPTSNPIFGAYATSSAFALTLSRPMIEALRMVVERQPERAVLFGRDLDALVRRGLVVMRCTVNIDPSQPAINRDLLPTRAGRLVWALLRETGQVPGGRPDPALAYPHMPPRVESPPVPVRMKEPSHG